MPKGSKVLMADDDKMLIDMYQERLELAGYKVAVCHNGEEALVKIREARPDIILLDIMMPKLNGYEALASLKSDPQTKDIPVIMLSALMRDFNREKAVEAGADDYLIKSEAMPSDVITKIEQVLSKYGKGATPTPGMAAPSIPAPSATPVSAPVAAAPPPASWPANTEKKEPVQEEVPVVKLQPNQSQPNQSQPAQSQSWQNDSSEEEKPKSSASMALIVILVILLTALVNDVVIYFFFIR